jgi:hypothetical protein
VPVGSTSFDVLKEHVKYRMGQDTGPESIGSDAVNYYGIWVNMAYKQICTANRMAGINKIFRIPELETSSSATTVDGTAYVSTPSDCIAVRTVFDETNDTKLTYIPLSTYLAYNDRATTTSEGDPNEWTRAGSKIYLHPTPDAANTLTIHYKKRPADLSGTDTTVIGDEWDEPIVMLAAYKGFTWQGAFDKSKAAMEEFVMVVAGLISAYDQQETDRDASMGPSTSYMG